MDKYVNVTKFIEAYKEMVRVKGIEFPEGYWTGYDDCIQDLIKAAEEEAK
jgi:hypothetical protein